MIRHIVAFDKNRGIAKNGVQPWKLPTDEKYFSDMTKTYGGILLMGRTTFEVIGRPLVGRQNYVASRQADFVVEDVTVVHDIDAFLNDHQDVWVIGGAEIYAATLSRTDELYITEIDADFGCDVFYPEFTEHFQIVDQGQLRHENNLNYRFNRYTPVQ